MRKAPSHEVEDKKLTRIIAIITWVFFIFVMAISGVLLYVMFLM